MSVIPESFKHEKDTNFPFSSELLHNWSQMQKKLSLRMQADLFKKSKLSVPGERIVLKLVNCLQEGVPGTSVAKELSHCTVEVLRKRIRKQCSYGALRVS